MLYTLKGKISVRENDFFVLEVHGVGFKVWANHQTILSLPKDTEAKIFCFLYVRDEQMELYGFREEQALKLFEMLNSVAGVGPKTALSVLDLDSPSNIIAAIIERRGELLTRTAGIGKKTAERIILELHNRLKLPETKALTEKMGIDIEVEEALVGLGYQRYRVKAAIKEVAASAISLEDRLRSALKILSKIKNQA